MEFVLRLIVSAAIFVVPVLLYVWLSRKSDTALYLLFPMVGLLPGTITAAILFVPIEHRFAANGHQGWTTPAVIAAGASVIWLVMFMMAAAGGRAKIQLLWKRARTSPRQFLLTMAVWMVLGGVWGACWRASAKAVGA